MPKPDYETYVQWRDRTINRISPTFCGAKWGNVTVWLNTGMNASCHHPPAHKIPLAEIARSHKALHNTEHKKLARKDLLEGKQTPECDYCWRAERHGSDVVSDRVFKSVLYSERQLKAWSVRDRDVEDVDPLTMELAFDSLCDFACSYCNASFSTTWSTDIRKRGPYINLKTEGHETYQDAGLPNKAGNEEDLSNPYLVAFWQWWNSGLSDSLMELRITGGETLMSPSFWRLLDWYRSHPGKGPKLAVNSNMGCSSATISKLLDRAQFVNHLEVYTSCESYEHMGEYVRDGFNWEVWTRNVFALEASPCVKHTHCMMTLSAISCWGLRPFLDWVVRQRQRLDRKYFLQTSFNILRFPKFQSVLSLPLAARQELATEVQGWLNATPREYINEFEIDSAKRYIVDLQSMPEPDNRAELFADLTSFLDQYDRRRGKDWRRTFPKLAAIS